MGKGKNKYVKGGAKSRQWDKYHGGEGNGGDIKRIFNKEGTPFNEDNTLILSSLLPRVERANTIGDILNILKKLGDDNKTEEYTPETTSRKIEIPVDEITETKDITSKELDNRLEKLNSELYELTKDLETNKTNETEKAIKKIKEKIGYLLTIAVKRITESSDDSEEKKFLAQVSEEAESVIKKVENFFSTTKISFDSNEYCEESISDAKNRLVISPLTEIAEMASKLREGHIKFKIHSYNEDFFINDLKSSSLERLGYQDIGNLTEMIISPEDYFKEKLKSKKKIQAGFMHYLYSKINHISLPEDDELREFAMSAFGLKDISPRPGDIFNPHSDAHQHIHPPVREGGIQDQIIEVKIHGYKYKDEVLSDSYVTISRG